MSIFNEATEKHLGTVSSNRRGGFEIKIRPRDYQATGAAEVEITRTRHDDGSITIDISPKG